MAPWHLVAVDVAEETIELGLQAAFAVIEQEANKGGKCQLPGACKCTLVEPVALDKPRLIQNRVYAAIGIFKFALEIASWWSPEGFYLACVI